MKYQSELIKEIVDSRGHKKSSIHYQSECVETWIEEVKGAYPKLCDYESEWLNYISALDNMGGSEEPEPPIGEFPYHVLTDVTETTVDNVVPYAYKSAILKGSTKYRDDTGEFFETFEEGRNLELVSVKMPVLTTSNKYTFCDFEIVPNSADKPVTETYKDTRSVTLSTTNKWGRIRYTINHVNNISYNLKFDYNASNAFVMELNGLSSQRIEFNSGTGSFSRDFVVTRDEVIKFGFPTGGTVEITNVEFSLSELKDEPFKANILTTSENVVLRGIGNVKDELNLLTGEVIQKIQEFTLDGYNIPKDYWYAPSSQHADTETYYISTRYLDDKLKSNGRVISNLLLEGETWDNDYECVDIQSATVGYMLRFRVNKSKLSELSVNGFIEFLKQNPITIYYELATESVKTVDLTITDQDGNTPSIFRPIEGTMHLSTSSDTIEPTFTGEVPVEAINQNLATFIEE